jgi:hypothetical protein
MVKTIPCVLTAIRWPSTASITSVCTPAGSAVRSARVPRGYAFSCVSGRVQYDGWRMQPGPKRWVPGSDRNPPRPQIIQDRPTGAIPAVVQPVRAAKGRNVSPANHLPVFRPRSDRLGPWPSSHGPGAVQRVLPTCWPGSTYLPDFATARSKQASASLQFSRRVYTIPREKPLTRHCRKRCGGMSAFSLWVKISVWWAVSSR